MSWYLIYLYHIVVTFEEYLGVSFEIHVQQILDVIDIEKLKEYPF